MEQKIIDFVNDNGLEFNSFESGLNANCVILVGYLLYLSEIDLEPINIEFVHKSILKDNGNTIEEFTRIWDYIVDNNHDYASFWKTDKAKEQYNF